MNVLKHQVVLGSGSRSHRRNTLERVAALSAVGPRACPALGKPVIPAVIAATYTAQL